eukprot:4721556-Pleurochrysis_carterae.AAC.1
MRGRSAPEEKRKSRLARLLSGRPRWETRRGISSVLLVTRRSVPQALGLEMSTAELIQNLPNTNHTHVSAMQSQSEQSGICERCDLKKPLARRGGGRTDGATSDKASRYVAQMWWVRSRLTHRKPALKASPAPVVSTCSRQE